ncbi:MAG: DUF6682 family protein, partial [Bilophila sp.]
PEGACRKHRRGAADMGDTMTGRDLVTQVLWTAQALEGAPVPRLLRDSGAVITANLLDFLNTAVRAVVTHCPQATAITESVRLEPGMRQRIPSRKIHRSQADAETLLRVTRNMGTDGETPGTPVLAAELAMLMAWGAFPSPAGQTHASVQNFAYDRLSNPSVFFVVPAVPEDCDVWVELTYSAKPKQLTSIDDLLPVSDEYEQALVHSMLYSIFAADADQGNLARAVQHQQAFISELDMKRQGDMVQYGFDVAGRSL